MFERLLADSLVLLHLAFILFVVFGGVLVLKWTRLAILHLPCAIWGVLIEAGGWVCHLTPLEQRFREAAGQAGYSGGFIDHYLMSVIYPTGLTRGMQLALGGLVLATNLCVYGLVVVKRANRKTNRAA